MEFFDWSKFVRKMSKDLKLVAELNSKNLELIKTCLHELRGNSGIDPTILIGRLESHLTTMLSVTQRLGEEVGDENTRAWISDDVIQKDEPHVTNTSPNSIIPPTDVSKNIVQEVKPPPISTSIRQRDRFTVIGLSQPEFKKDLETIVSPVEFEDVEKVRAQVELLLRVQNAKINEFAVVNQKGFFEVVPKVIEEHKVYFMMTFKVTKYSPNIIRSKSQRVWSIDCFQRRISSVNGSKTKEYSMDDICVLQKNLNDNCVCRIGFSKVTHDIELIFENSKERQVFYELCYSMRRTTLIMCPKYAPHDKPLARAVLVDKKGVVKVNVTPIQTEQLSVFALEWNMNMTSPSIDNKPLRDLASGYDIYAFAIQKGMKGMLHYFDDLLGKEYTLISYESHWSVKLIIYIKSKHIHKVSNIEYTARNFTSEMDPLVLTYKLQNTGSVAVSFKILDSSFCFISFEMFGQNNPKLKQNMIVDMCTNFKLGNQSVDLSQFDNVFWMGNVDMYLNCTESVALDLCGANNVAELLSKDPISMEIQSKRILSGYQEGKINFLPTSRWSKSEKAYEKKCIPSYPNRIFSRGASLKLLNYDSIPDLETSIHIPVYATYQVDATRIVSSLFADPVERIIFLKDFKVTDRPDTLGVVKKPQISIFGEFLVQTPVHSTRRGKTEASTNPNLKIVEVPPLRLLVSNQEYLEHASLVIQFLDLSRHVYLIGTARLDIPPKSLNDPVRFSVPMQHGTVFTGNLEGTIVCKVLVE
jgi:hypothetical protein